MVARTVGRWLLPGPAVQRAVGSSASFASVTLSESRLQEFMKAEIGHIASMAPRPVKLKHIMNTSTLEQAAKLIHTQLPWHMASRIKHIEAVPRWETVHEFVEVHGILTKSFRNLRMVEQEEGPGLGPLVGVIRDLRERHKAVIPLLGSAVASLRESGDIDEAFANKWLDTFLLARIGTEMLAAHFMSMYTHRDDEGSSVIGIVDSRCNPGEICRMAAAKIKKDAEYSSVPISVQSHVCTASNEIIEFSFLPRYLSLIVEELLKNSATATLRHRCSAGGASPRDEVIEVIVAADQRHVKIGISDKGGGIPARDMDRLWSYSFGTMEHQEDHAGMSDMDMASGLSWADPLAGLGIRRKLGMGMPLSKLYTGYLGGSLESMSLPGVGVDTYLSLSRLDVGSFDEADLFEADT